MLNPEQIITLAEAAGKKANDFVSAVSDGDTHGDYTIAAWFRGFGVALSVHDQASKDAVWERAWGVAVQLAPEQWMAHHIQYCFESARKAAR